jgi:hypothetical protein
VLRDISRSVLSSLSFIICRYLSEQLRQNIVLLGQQVVAICIAPRDAFILNSDACLFRLAWILNVFEMLMSAKLVSEAITRIGVSLLLGSCNNLAGPDNSSGLQLSPNRAVGIPIFVLPTTESDGCRRILQQKK